MAVMQDLYIEQERYGEAKVLGNEVVSWRNEALGRKHPDTINSVLKMASAWDYLGQYSETVRALTEALEVWEHVVEST